MLTKGTRVLLRTTNGGECIGYLCRDYEPTYRVEILPERGAAFWVEASRIRSIEPADWQPPNFNPQGASDEKEPA